MLCMLLSKIGFGHARLFAIQSQTLFGRAGTAMNDNATNAEDKRIFIRMSIDSEAFITLPGDNQKRSCICKDLSAAGMLLDTDFDVSEGTEVLVLIPSQTAGFDDLEAMAEVMRAQVLDNNRFLLGVKITTML